MNRKSETSDDDILLIKKKTMENITTRNICDDGGHKENLDIMKHGFNIDIIVKCKCGYPSVYEKFSRVVVSGKTSYR